MVKQNTKKEEPVCICKNCPSFIECGEAITYCFKGKSKCIKIEKGCICGGCPVYEKYKFAHGYYCTRGSEKEIK